MNESPHSFTEDGMTATSFKEPKQKFSLRFLKFYESKKKAIFQRAWISVVVLALAGDGALGYLFLKKNNAYKEQQRILSTRIEENNKKQTEIDKLNNDLSSANKIIADDQAADAAATAASATASTTKSSTRSTTSKSTSAQEEVIAPPPAPTD